MPPQPPASIAHTPLQGPTETNTGTPADQCLGAYGAAPLSLSNTDAPIKQGSGACGASPLSHSNA
jgi:hypothetical protein